MGGKRQSNIGKPCSVAYCMGPAKIRGLCHRHYLYFFRHGRLPEAPTGRFNTIFVRGATAWIVLKDRKFNISSEVIIDACDVPGVKDFQWGATQSNITAGAGGRLVQLARFILGCNDAGKAVRHLSGNMFDCRRTNLVACSRSHAAHLNRRRRDNKPGCKGVYWITRRQTWSVELKVNGKRHFGGYFDDLDEAKMKRSELESEHLPPHLWSACKNEKPVKKTQMCSAPHCAAPARFKGLCAPHYSQMLSKGRVYEDLPGSPNVVAVCGDKAWIRLMGPGGVSRGEALIDAEYLMKVKDLRWSCGQHTISAIKDCKPVLLPRLITGCRSKSKFVMTANKNYLDCRKANLTVVDKVTLARRQGGWKKSRSGIKGVAWSSLKKRWIASITIGGRSIQGGYFKDKDEAAARRKELEAGYLK